MQNKQNKQNKTVIKSFLESIASIGDAFATFSIWPTTNYDREVKRYIKQVDRRVEYIRKQQTNGKRRVSISKHFKTKT